MIPCPHCGLAIELPDPPEHNVLNYGKPAITVTLCCGYGVILTRVQNIRITASYGPERDDDWGHKIKEKLRKD